jgi:hypothetical protein
MRTGRVATSAAAADPTRGTQTGIALADSSASLILERGGEASARGARIHAWLDSATSTPPGAPDLATDLAELLADLPGEKPEAFVVTGLRSAADTRNLRAAIQARWGSCSTVVSFDGRLGFGGAAAIPSLVALSCGLFSNSNLALPIRPLAASEEGDAVGAEAISSTAIRRLAVLSLDLDDALGAAIISAPEPRP